MAGAQARRGFGGWTALRRRPTRATTPASAPVPVRSCLIWDRDGLRVTAHLDTEGGLCLAGTHVRRDSTFSAPEYHYEVRVVPQEVGLVVRALAGAGDDDVIDLLLQRGEQVVRWGESRWLEQAGVTPRLSSWLSLD
ncbi:MAG: hypothetical protein U0Q15_01195 [Kineosporiaceae bacterium]